jgi:membrane-associated phospholipid phosphatase
VISTNTDTRPLSRRTALRAAGGIAAGAALLGATSLPPRVRAQGSTGQVEPRAGRWQPWLLAAGDQFRPAPPPDAAATRQELAELTALAARRDAATRDRIAYWDAGAAPYRWIETTIEWTVVRNNLANGFLWRAFALVSVAMHDAMIAVWDAKYTYNRPRPTAFDASLTAAVPVPRSPSYPSEHAAAAGAAAAVLGYLFPNDAQTFTGMAEEAAMSRVQAGVQYPSDAVAGMDLGRNVAALVIERARNDNSDMLWTGAVPTGPGLWTGMNPGGVADATWKPWVLSSPSQFRPDPPPAFGSDELAAEMAELKTFMRTPHTNGLALMGQYGSTAGNGGSMGIVDWVRRASRHIFEERLDQNAPWAARLYALLSVGLYDIWIATQDAKFTYWAIRPHQLDPSFTTVFPTPNHPSYPSNRAALGMAGEVLGHFFPRDAQRFRKVGEEISESAIWAGIHFRSDLAAGIAMGEGVARLLIDRIRADG